MQMRRTLAASLVMLVTSAHPGLAQAETAATAEAVRPPSFTFGKSLDLALPAGSDPTHLIVKVAKPAAIPTDRAKADGTLTTNASTPALLDTLRARVGGMTVMPLFDMPRLALDMLRLEGERRSGKRLVDLSTFYVVRLGDAAAAADVLAALLLDDNVETVYARPSTTGPVDIAPPTPYYGSGQTYRGIGPDGVDFDSATSAPENLSGAGVTLADVEQNWSLDHEDLDHLLASQMPAAPLVPVCDWADADCDNPLGRCSTRPTSCTNPADVDHGMAVLGVLTANRGSYGVDGFATGATIRVVPTSRLSNPNWTGVNAVMTAILALDPGDIILLEAQIQVGLADFVPFETFPAEFAVVEQATALGIHVIEPAANTLHGMNLDTDPRVLEPGSTGPLPRSLFNRYVRDSGSVLVGGGDSASFFQQPNGNYHRRYCNSNYGSRVDTYAWGQNVTTAGYAGRIPGAGCNLHTSSPNLNQDYTACFNGTSSAGAIAAAAAALLEERHQRDYGRPFSPRELRNHLSLGTPSTAPIISTCANVVGTVGHQPDLRYAMDFLDQGGIISHLFEAEPGVATGSPEYEFGAAIAEVGDLDQDGTVDLAIGAPNTTVPNGTGGTITEAGRVYVFSGRSGRLLLRQDGTQAFEHFGSAVAKLDSWPGFPWGGVAIGASGWDDTTASLTDAGDVRTFWYIPISTTPSGNSLQPIPGSAYNGTTTSEFYGEAIAYLAPDRILIGAPGDVQAFPAAVTGSATVLRATGQVLYKSSGTAIGDDHGYAVAAAGDLNSDGTTDWLVGAPGAVVSSVADSGTVTAFSGATGTVLFSKKGDRVVNLSTPALRYGSALATVDFDSDGTPEVAVGVPGSPHSGPGSTTGRVDLLDKSGNRLAWVSGTHPRSFFGSSLASVGDFDGDGFDDLAVGVPTNTSAFFLATPGGEVVILRGRKPNNDGSYTPIAQRRFWTLAPRTQWGSAVAVSADLNGDGNPEVFAAEPFGQDGGRAFIFSSGPAPDPWANQPRLIADAGVIEVKDVSTNGQASGCDGLTGGLTSPADSSFVIDAGPAWAGESFAVLGIDANGAFIDWGPFLVNNIGTLDANGRSPLISPPTLGPFPANQTCPTFIGASFDFLGVAFKLRGGVITELQVTNQTSVQLITEFTNCTCP